MPVFTVQPPSFAEQFGYAQSYFGKALSSLTDTYSHIYGAKDGEVDFADAIMQRRILVVLLPSLEKAPAELASLGPIYIWQPFSHSQRLRCGPWRTYRR